MEEQSGSVSVLNERFYDMAAEIYESADGRRKTMPLWLRRNIGEPFTGKYFLDLGAGKGYIAHEALKYYRRVYAVDISLEMCKRIDKSIIARQGDITQNWGGFLLEPMMFGFDKICCVSTLHHIENWKAVLSQVVLNLRGGGVFYSDLDMDKEFARRWSGLLRLYRKIKDPAGRYIKRDSRITRELYNKVEVKSEGIDTEEMADYLRSQGMRVKTVYHWGKYKPFPCGLAPYASIWAVKPNGV